MSYNRDQDEATGKSISVYSANDCASETHAVDQDELTYLQEALKDAEFEREQYKSARDDLLHHLYMAIPFIEDAVEDQAYKPGAVKKALSSMRGSIAKAESIQTPSSN